jgi:hypothetical protein
MTEDAKPKRKPKCPFRGMDICIENECAWWYGEFRSCALWAIPAYLSKLEEE